MKMTGYWPVVSLFTVGLLGCSSSDWESYQLFPDDYAYEVPYDSIYHYGYNQGCETALSVKGVTNTEYLKDATLESSDTDYLAGWEAGKQACNSGQQVIMPSSRISPSSSNVDSSKR